MIFIFLSSGLFLGWSLGANDAANVFGTAVGSKMIRFKTAAIISSIFVIIGAVVGGSGAAHTLGKLGAINAIAGSFMVAFSAGFTVYWMTRLKLPVSTSQAIVGAIIGWNLFSGYLTDYDSLTKILLTWVLCPVLSAIIASSIFIIFRNYLNNAKIHLLRMDMRMRIGLILVGAFGSYSLGANNIANVMGVFISANPLSEINFFNLFTLSGTQVLFLIGGIAIAVGIITYSHKVMDTVGGSLMKLSPGAALVIVLSQAIVLFLFSSEGLEHWLISHGLPAIPLVPVSSSQAVVGAIIGIGLVKGGKGLHYRVLGEIGTGWITTPVIAGIITFFALFFLQNVFNQTVYLPSEYQISEEVIEYLKTEKNIDDDLNKLMDKSIQSESELYYDLKKITNLEDIQINQIIQASVVYPIWIDPLIVSTQLDSLWLSKIQLLTINALVEKTYNYRWQLDQALIAQSDSWSFKPSTKLNRPYNKSLKAKYEYLYRIFSLKNN